MMPETLNLCSEVLVVCPSGRATGLDFRPDESHVLLPSLKSAQYVHKHNSQSQV